NADESEEKHRLSLVGRVLTDSVVHFPSIRSTLANLWCPVEGISITDIGEKRSLFKFYHEIDLKKIYNLPMVFMSEGMVRQLGDFIGEFVKYYATPITKRVKKYMKVKVKLDVRKPLKRKKRIAIK
ncbi:hypothetical protein Goshw_025371, partial [Gossypium schwendimanii]|nr:hypothetical protein [Gossypium schwendimanii]